MIQPIHVRVDLAAHAAYVNYAPGPSVSTVDLNDTGSVAYDVDEAGTIVGIEVLEVQMPGQIALARTFADEHGLAFPRDLAGTPLERHALLVGAAFPVRYDGTGSMHTH